MLFIAQSVTLYLLVTTTGAPSQTALVTSSLTKATVTAPSQLSSASVTTLISAAGISLKHCIVTGAGLLAVGSIVSSTVIVWVTSMLFIAQSVTLYLLVTTTGAPSQTALVTSSLTKATVTAPSQLSSASVTTLISAAGISLKHCIVTGAGLLAVGSIVSSTVIV